MLLRQQVLAHGSYQVGQRLYLHRRCCHFPNESPDMRKRTLSISPELVDPLVANCLVGFKHKTSSCHRRVSWALAYGTAISVTTYPYGCAILCHFAPQCRAPSSEHPHFSLHSSHDGQAIADLERGKARMGPERWRPLQAARNADLGHSRPLNNLSLASWHSLAGG